MAATAEQFTRLEERVDSVAAKTNRLEGASFQLVTKSDINDAHHPGGIGPYRPIGNGPDIQR